MIFPDKKPLIAEIEKQSENEHRKQLIKLRKEVSNVILTSCSRECSLYVGNFMIEVVDQVIGELGKEDYKAQFDKDDDRLAISF